MAAADKRLRTAKRRQRRGVVGAEHQMATFIDQVSLFLRGSAPKQEGHTPGTGRYLRDQGVRQGFPSPALVAVGLTFFDRQAGIQEQSTLLRPRNKAAAGYGHGRPSFAQITLALFEDVAQGGRKRLAGRNGKGQTLGLAAPVVGVLAQDDGVHCLQRRQRQSAQRLGRKHLRALFYPPLQKSEQALALSGIEKASDRWLPIPRYRPVPGVGSLQTRRSGFLGE